MKKALIPLGIFIVLVVFLAIGLTRDPHEVPSPLIGKAAPAFTAPIKLPNCNFASVADTVRAFINRSIKKFIDRS